MTKKMNRHSWVKDILREIYKKYEAVIGRHGKDFIFYQSENGVYQLNMAEKDITWWTNGFDAGIFWQLNHFKENKDFQSAAIIQEKELDQAFIKYKGLHHDVGFMWLPSAVENYRLTKNKDSFWRGMHAADLLAGRFNITGNYLRSWNKDRAGWVIIDSMLNIQLLYWASEVTNDPRFKKIADAHAHTVLKNHIRGDGSVAHIVAFDPNTGEKLTELGGQGFDKGSSWSRGQSWGLYGFAAAYRHTKKYEYLVASQRIANYFITNISQSNFIPRIDFRSPKNNGSSNDIDTSAAACAASGLLSLASELNSSDSELYIKIAIRILYTLNAKFANYDENTDGVLSGGAVSYRNQHNVNLNYGDYYFIEALMRLSKINLEIF